MSELNCRCKKNSRSQWNLRNGSANVAAVLHSKNYLQHEPEVTDRTCLGTNTCYCSEKSVKPVLFTRLKSCNSVSDFEYNFERTESIEDVCRQSGVVRLRREDGDRNEWQKPVCTSFFDSTDEVQKKLSETFMSDSNGGDDVTYGNLYDGGSTEEFSLKSLSTFRKNHYFETHCVEQFTQTVPEHECVHKFDLDERNLPFPLKTDVFGESRCDICEKPRENNRNLSEKEGSSVSFPEFYKYGLVPRKIFLPDSDVRLEVSDWRKSLLEDSERDRSWSKKGKRPNYSNTFALRYQKGVV